MQVSLGTKLPKLPGALVKQSKAAKGLDLAVVEVRCCLCTRGPHLTVAVPTCRSSQANAAAELARLKSSTALQPAVHTLCRGRPPMHLRVPAGAA